MKFSSKVFIASVHVVCLILTLLMPNDLLVVSLLPYLITPATWVLPGVAKDTNAKIVKCLYIIAIGLFFIAYLVIGLISDIVYCADYISKYCVVINQPIAFIGNVSFDYLYYGLTCGIILLLLYGGELYYSGKAKKETTGYSIAREIETYTKEKRQH